MARTTTIQKNSEEALWIGLVGVIPNPGNKCFGDAKGAYVNVITSATNIESYREKVKQALNELGMSLSEVENPELLSKRLSKRKAGKEILQMAETATKLNSVVFGTFHTYNNEEEG